MDHLIDLSRFQCKSRHFNLIEAFKSEPKQPAKITSLKTADTIPVVSVKYKTVKIKPVKAKAIGFKVTKAKPAKVVKAKPLKINYKAETTKEVKPIGYTVKKIPIVDHIIIKPVLNYEQRSGLQALKQGTRLVHNTNVITKLASKGFASYNNSMWNITDKGLNYLRYSPMM